MACALNRIAHQHIATLGTRYGALDEQQALFGIHARHFQILGGHALNAHMAGHLLVLEGLARILTVTGRTMRTVADGNPVRGFKPREVPALHRTREALTNRHTGHIHLLPRNEMRGRKDGAGFQHGIGSHAEFDNLTRRFHTSLREVTLVRLGDVLGLRNANAELNGFIAILVSAALRHHAHIVHVQQRDGNGRTVLIEQPGHAQLLGDQACAAIFRGHDGKLPRPFRS